MAIRRLYISHQNYNFSGYYSEFLNSKNVNEILESKIGLDVHTTIEDSGFTISEIEDLLDKCQYIELKDLELPSQYDEKFIYYLGLAIILSTKYKKNSTGWENLVKDTQLIKKFWLRQHNGQRPADDTCLWIAGCSFSSAIGVKPIERWSSLVAKELNLSEINLAKPGSSIWFSSDQILRADIQKGDLVVWGLTSTDRLDFFYNNAPQSWSLSTILKKDKWPSNYISLEYFNGDSPCFMAIRQILQVINYCNKIGANLYIINFLDKELSNMLDNILDLSMFYPMENFIDLGTDGAHPGPLQHKEYAKEIIKFIQGT